MTERSGLPSEDCPGSRVATDCAAARASWLDRVAFFGILLLAIGLRMYLALAQPLPMLWFDTGNYVWGSIPGAAPSFDRPLGYSWLLRALRAVSMDLRLIQLAQMAMGVLAALALYGIGRRLMPSPRWASLAVLALTLLWPLNVIMETYVLAETPFLLVVAVIGLVVVHGAERRSPTLLAIAGVLLGLATLLRATGLVFCVSFPAMALLLLRPAEDLAPLRRLSRSWWAPVTTAAPCLIILLAYASYYHEHRGVWALESWSGITRYAMLAPLIDPEAAGPDTRAVEILRAHQEGHARGATFVMWDPDSPLAHIRRGLALSMPELDSWAERTAVRTVLRKPTAAAMLLARNAYRDLTAIDSFDRQVPIDPTLPVQKATLAVYGIDATGWELNHQFRLPGLLALYQLKPLLVLGLFLAAALSVSPRFRHPYQLIAAANAAWLVLVVSLTVAAEQRHIHVAENLLILNLALALGQLWTELRGRRR